MFLAVSKTDGFYAFKVLLGPKQAGGGILPTGEAYQSGILMFHIFLVLYVVQQAHGKGNVPLRCKDKEIF
jgi:hypothetical protein